MKWFNIFTATKIQTPSLENLNFYNQVFEYKAGWKAVEAYYWLSYQKRSGNKMKIERFYAMALF